LKLKEITEIELNSSLKI